ncbi:MAG TPA: hypothetical protein VHF51_02720, partial [Solirubrobacteraceae bacterium]|nr:hypothetical protein [Solirubrobacteraceae bacterium]
MSRRRAAPVVAAALLAAGCGGRDGAVTDSDARAAAQAMTSAQLAGAHVVFPFAGTRPRAALLARLRRGEAAGVILLGRNVGSPARLRALTRRVRAAVPRGAPPPL